MDSCVSMARNIQSSGLRLFLAGTAFLLFANLEQVIQFQVSSWKPEELLIDSD
jgi:hypothetical protein